MKKMAFLTTTILFLVITVPAMAQVTIEVAPPPPPPTLRVAVPLPPPILFAAPPQVIVLPETEVYVVPSVPEEIFFYNGYWWRPWSGRWYRSLYYDRGWGVYAGVPVWYGGIYPGWRENYRLGLWGGHPWHYHHISHHDLHQNWRTWHNTHYWQKPEHREFTHHHDGRLYTASHQDTKKSAAKTNVNKSTTGAAQGRTTTQANVNKSTTATGQGQLNKSTKQGNVNKTTTATGQGQTNKTTTQGTLDKGTTTSGQGNTGAGGHGATGTNVHGSGQGTKGQHN